MNDIWLIICIICSFCFSKKVYFMEQYTALLLKIIQVIQHIDVQLMHNHFQCFPILNLVWRVYFSFNWGSKNHCSVMTNIPELFGQPCRQVVCNLLIYIIISSSILQFSSWFYEGDKLSSETAIVEQILSQQLATL